MDRMEWGMAAAKTSCQSLHTELYAYQNSEYPYSYNYVYEPPTLPEDENTMQCTFSHFWSGRVVGWIYLVSVRIDLVRALVVTTVRSSSSELSLTVLLAGWSRVALSLFLVTWNPMWLLYVFMFVKVRWQPWIPHVILKPGLVACARRTCGRRSSYVGAQNSVHNGHVKQL